MSAADIDVYCLRSQWMGGKAVPRWRLAIAKDRPDKLGRLWQAEWEGCQHAPRAWTEVGCWRKAKRWRLWHRDKSKLRRVSSWLSRRS